MTTPDPDAAARRALSRRKAVATAMLGAMAVLVVAARLLPRSGWAGLLEAAATAGLVGGVADWFAVTALFRRPLGLPIPHTAVIPAQKDRLGHALGRFVAGHVFTQDEVARALARVDLPGMLAGVLRDPAVNGPAARALAGLLPRILAGSADAYAARLAARLIPRLLGGAGAGRLIARALRGLMASGQHQEMLSFLLSRLRATLATREDTLRGLVEDRVREQGGRLVGWAIGTSVATRVLGALRAELDKVGPDDSELRAAFDAWADAEIARLETDPDRAAEIGRAMRAALSQEVVRDWLGDVAARMRAAVQADAARPESRAAAALRTGLEGLGDVLAGDPVARAGLRRAAEGVAHTVLPQAQARLAEFIGRAVAGWNTATLVDRLELRVGRDLQYIRMNGTLVGFLVGGLLHLALAAAFGG